LTNLL
jgi:hypothetical protein